MLTTPLSTKGGNPIVFAATTATDGNATRAGANGSGSQQIKPHSISGDGPPVAKSLSIPCPTLKPASLPKMGNSHTNKTSFPASATLPFPEWWSSPNYQTAQTAAHREIEQGGKTTLPGRRTSSVLAGLLHGVSHGTQAVAVRRLEKQVASQYYLALGYPELSPLDGNGFTTLSLHAETGRSNESSKEQTTSQPQATHFHTDKRMTAYSCCINNSSNLRRLHHISQAGQALCNLIEYFASTNIDATLRETIVGSIARLAAILSPFPRLPEIEKRVYELLFETVSPDLVSVPNDVTQEDILKEVERFKAFPGTRILAQKQHPTGLRVIVTTKQAQAIEMIETVSRLFGTDNAAVHYTLLSLLALRAQISSRKAVSSVWNASWSAASHSKRFCELALPLVSRLLLEDEFSSTEERLWAVQILRCARQFEHLLEEVIGICSQCMKQSAIPVQLAAVGTLVLSAKAPLSLIISSFRAVADVLTNELNLFDVYLAKLQAVRDLLGELASKLNSGTTLSEQQNSPTQLLSPLLSAMGEEQDLLSQLVHINDHVLDLLTEKPESELLNHAALEVLRETLRALRAVGRFLHGKANVHTQASSVQATIEQNFSVPKIASSLLPYLHHRSCDLSLVAVQVVENLCHLECLYMSKQRAERAMSPVLRLIFDLLTGMCSLSEGRYAKVEYLPLMQGLLTAVERLARTSLSSDLTGDKHTEEDRREIGHLFVSRYLPMMATHLHIPWHLTELCRTFARLFKDQNIVLSLDADKITAQVKDNNAHSGSSMTSIIAHTVLHSGTFSRNNPKAFLSFMILLFRTHVVYGDEEDQSQEDRTLIASPEADSGRKKGSQQGIVSLLEEQRNSTGGITYWTLYAIAKEAMTYGMYDVAAAAAGQLINSEPGALCGCPVFLSFSISKETLGWVRGLAELAKAESMLLSTDARAKAGFKSSVGQTQAQVILLYRDAMDSLQHCSLGTAVSQSLAWQQKWILARLSLLEVTQSIKYFASLVKHAGSYGFPKEKVFRLKDAAAKVCTQYVDLLSSSWGADEESLALLTNMLNLSIILFRIVGILASSPVSSAPSHVFEKRSWSKHQAEQLVCTGSVQVNKLKEFTEDIDDFLKSALGEKGPLYHDPSSMDIEDQEEQDILSVSQAIHSVCCSIQSFPVPVPRWFFLPASGLRFHLCASLDQPFILDTKEENRNAALSEEEAGPLSDISTEHRSRKSSNFSILIGAELDGDAELTTADESSAKLEIAGRIVLPPKRARAKLAPESQIVSIALYIKLAHSKEMVGTQTRTWRKRVAIKRVVDVPKDAGTNNALRSLLSIRTGSGGSFLSEETAPGKSPSSVLGIHYDTSVALLPLVNSLRLEGQDFSNYHANGNAASALPENLRLTVEAFAIDRNGREWTSADGSSKVTLELPLKTVDKLRAK